MVTKKKSNKRIIALVIITTVIALCLSLSKFFSTVSQDANGEIAKIVIDLDTNDVLDTQMLPVDLNSSQELAFMVINGIDDKKSDVTLAYTLELSSLSNLPLDFEIYKLNGDTGEYEILELEAGKTIDKFEIKTSDEGQNYKIKINWKDGENYTSYKYADLLDYVLITVDSEQVD